MAKRQVKIPKPFPIGHSWRIDMKSVQIKILVSDRLFLRRCEKLASQFFSKFNRRFDGQPL